MPIKIKIIPCLTDNYAYILHDMLSNKTTLIDAPDFNPINKVLEKEKWGLDNILITHHHSDHIAGIDKLVNKYNPKIFGAESDIKRLPPLDVTLADRDKFSVSNLIFKTIDVSGHTIGHLAFYCPSEKIIFTGDSLMTLGCGRIFEGTPKQMFESLNQLKELPKETIVYSGHEYADKNAQFALTVDPKNYCLIDQSKKIKDNLIKGIPNVALSLEDEKRTNPFLRSDNFAIKTALGMENSSDLEIFTVLRELKDTF